MTLKEKNIITGRSIAHRLRGKGHTGARLERAIDEVRDQLCCEAERGVTTVAALRAFELSTCEPSKASHRHWLQVVRAAKESLSL